MSDSNSMWELKHLEKMEFNTATLYNGNFFHSAYLKKGMFKDHYRLSQVFFIPDRVKSLRALGPPTTKILRKLLINEEDETLRPKNFDENHTFTYTE